MTAFLRLLAAALVLAASAAPAGAHTRSETQSVWRILGSTVHLTFTIPDLEARRLGEAGNLPESDQLGAYLAGRVAVLHGADECARGPAQAVAASPGFQRFEFAFECPDANDLSLHSAAFFDLVPTHVTYAQIIPETGDFISQLIVADNQTLALSTATGQSELQNAGLFEYVFLGIEHIFTGYDHQAFILALILLSQRLRDLVFVVTGFTLGHSLSLSLAVLGILRPETAYIDSLVSLTIAMVAAENIAHSSHRTRTIALAFGGLLLAFAVAHIMGFPGLPITILLGAGIFAVCYMMMSGHIKDAARLRLIVTFAFGTIHGFSFAASLIDMRLPAGRLAELLVGFNVGVEFGQLAVVAVILTLVAILGRLRLTLPRPIVVDVMSAALVGLGLYWFMTKGYALA